MNLNTLLEVDLPPVVLDKCYAQRSRRGSLQELSRRYTIVVTSSFYFEMLTKLEDSRRHIFLGFPEFCRIHTPTLYREERVSNEPVKIASPRLTINPDFVSGKREMTAAERACLADFEEQSVRPIVAFWKEVMQHGVVGFSHSEIRATLGNVAALKELCRRILDGDFVRDIASQLEVPVIHRLNDEWITFRKIQVLLLHGVMLRYFYPDPARPRSDVELEHDVHDVDYLILALHAGAFATDESASDCRKLGWRFQFLLPSGTLHSNARAAPVAQPSERA